MRHLKRTGGGDDEAAPQDAEDVDGVEDETPEERSDEDVESDEEYDENYGEIRGDFDDYEN